MNGRGGGGSEVATGWKVELRPGGECAGEREVETVGVRHGGGGVKRKIPA